MREIRPIYADLENAAADIRDHAKGQLADDKLSDTGRTRLLDVMLKAIRLEAELREKSAAPAQIDAVQAELREVRRALAAHHAGNADRSQTKTTPRSQDITWEQ